MIAKIASLIIESVQRFVMLHAGTFWDSVVVDDSLTGVPSTISYYHLFVQTCSFIWLRRLQYCWINHLSADEDGHVSDWYVIVLPATFTVSFVRA